ncbi:MAG: M23 family metallopeptidase [Cyanobacteria bacterium P01_D01_bin.156]
MSSTGLKRTLTSWTLTALVASPAFAYCLHRPFHHGVNVALALVGVPGARERVGTRSIDLTNDAPATVGEQIGGYRITSGFGVRRHPVTGVQKPHKGVDVATPVGTPVYALASKEAGSMVRVTCWNDKNGGIIALISADLLPGKTVKLMHLDACYRGVHGQGDVIAKSGNTGLYTTGPHLHVEYVLANGTHTPPTVSVVSWLLTGIPPTKDGETVAPALTDTDIVCAIGAAEGTRDRNCDRTAAHESHIDPGNGVRNQGTFSYQHGAASAEEADAKQLANLRKIETIILDRADAAGVTLETVELLSIIDQYNQSPAAALGRNGTLDRIIDARAKSYINPDTGRLDAPGLGNTMPNVVRDQTRRTEAIADSLDQRHLLP